MKTDFCGSIITSHMSVILKFSCAIISMMQREICEKQNTINNQQFCGLKQIVAHASRQTLTARQIVCKFNTGVLSCEHLTWCE